MLPYDVDGDGLVDIAVANDTVQNFLFHNMGHGKFEEIAHSFRASRSTSRARRAGAWAVDWASFMNDDRLGLAVGNFANEMTALYVCDQPASLAVLRPGQPLRPGRAHAAAAQFGLFFFDYDLDGRLDLLSANGHLEPEISKVQASETYEQPIQLFWNSGKVGRNL